MGDERGDGAGVCWGDFDEPLVPIFRPNSLWVKFSNWLKLGWNIEKLRSYLFP